jgi:hypothetical protein
MRRGRRSGAGTAARAAACACACAALFVSVAPCCAADTPAATARASKTEVTVGETFTVEVHATGPAGAIFDFPSETSQESFELRTAPLPETKEPAHSLPPGTHLYQAAVFTVGDAEIPAIPVHYRLADGTTGEIKTAPIPLRVASLLPRDKSEQKLADVRPPVAVPLGRVFWAGVALVAVLLGALVWWIVTRRRREAPALAPVEPAIAADEEARRALEALLASGRLARGEYRPFYIELTAIAKRYLERRLGAPIVEMTTAEMLAWLKADTRAADLAPTMRDLSGAADQIKFARGAGQEQEAARHMAAARALIEALETRLKPATPAGGQAA